jgi:choloylglycine hydrolase
MGCGLLGIPGDFTPPSRFVQAVFFSKSAIPADNCIDAVLQIFHILNQFDIPPGSSRVTRDESNGTFISIRRSGRT